MKEFVQQRQRIAVMVHPIIDRLGTHVNWRIHGAITAYFSVGRRRNLSTIKTCLSRGPPNRYEDESPPRNAGKQQKPAGGGKGYVNTIICIRIRLYV